MPVRYVGFPWVKPECGFPKLLSLSTFNNDANGYLIDDCYIFEEEVFIIECTGREESLSMIKHRPCSDDISDCHYTGNRIMHEF